MKFGEYEQTINLSPNLGLITPIDTNAGGNMSTNNIWDSIEVEMFAEFDAVKISLGELKNIEDGMVVDLASIYDNRVTLRVENKVIAHGELAIINDRYGVKITDVVEQNQTEQPSISNDTTESVENENVHEDIDEFETNNEETVTDERSDANSDVNSDEEFDYSDFELEDEDI